MLGYYGLGGYYIMAVISTIVSVIVLLISLGLYVLYALGFMKIAQRLGFPNPWLAWVPFGNLYLKGQMVPEITLFGNRFQKMEMLLPIVCGALTLLGFATYYIPYVGIIFLILFCGASWALTSYVSYPIIKCFDPQRAVILSIFYHIGFFVLKDKPAVAPTPVYTPKPAAPAYGAYNNYQQPGPQQQYQAPQQAAPQPQYAPPQAAPQYQPAPQQQYAPAPQAAPQQYQPAPQPQYAPPQAAPQQYAPVPPPPQPVQPQPQVPAAENNPANGPQQ